MKLDVYFGAKKAGELCSTGNRGIVFAYDKNYLADRESQKLSASLPLQNEEFSQKQCLPFFSGLLPEGDSKKKISDFLHISETSALKLLEALGGECAGLITLTGEEFPALQQDCYSLDEKNYEPLSHEKICEFIRRIPSRPLMKADDKLRLSLAGAQEKLALARIGSEWYLPLNGAPSTHILKPSREGSLSTLAQNEYCCMRLAKEFSLAVPPVDIINFGGKDVFVIERYDRIIEGKSIRRLHQEDFCQARALMSEIKYQNDGGPGVTELAETIRAETSFPAVEMQKMLRSLIFNFLIGNCDCHGKNYSIIYESKKTTLAPLYDAVSTTIYSGLSDKLSMKIGRHYEIEKVTSEDFRLLSDSIRIHFSAVTTILKEFEKRLGKAAAAVKADGKTDGELLERILEGFCQRLKQAS